MDFNRGCLKGMGAIYEQFNSEGSMIAGGKRELALLRCSRTMTCEPPSHEHATSSWAMQGLLGDCVREHPLSYYTTESQASCPVATEVDPIVASIKNIA